MLLCSQQVALEDLVNLILATHGQNINHQDELAALAAAPQAMIHVELLGLSWPVQVYATQLAARTSYAGCLPILSSVRIDHGPYNMSSWTSLLF